MSENFFECESDDHEDSVAVWKKPNSTVSVRVKSSYGGTSEEGSIGLPIDQARALAHAILRMCGDENVRKET